MDRDYLYALSITFVYSILGFINRNSTQEKKTNLKNRIEWLNATTKALFDAGFAILFFSAVSHIKPELSAVFRVGIAVFLAVFIAETFVEAVKEYIKKWKN